MGKDDRRRHEYSGVCPPGRQSVPQGSAGGHDEPVGLCLALGDSLVLQFISIATHPRMYVPPGPLPLALEAMDVWIQVPGCELLAEGPGYWETLRKLVRKAAVKGPMIHDARIAALCLHHGVTELWSADRDFSRYPALKVRNPL